MRTENRLAAAAADLVCRRQDDASEYDDYGDEPSFGAQPHLAPGPSSITGPQHESPFGADALAAAANASSTARLGLKPAPLSPVGFSDAILQAHQAGQAASSWAATEVQVAEAGARLQKLAELEAVHTKLTSNYTTIAAHPTTDIGELHATIESLSQQIRAHRAVAGAGPPPATPNG